MVKSSTAKKLVAILLALAAVLALAACSDGAKKEEDVDPFATKKPINVMDAFDAEFGSQEGAIELSGAFPVEGSELQIDRPYIVTVKGLADDNEDGYLWVKFYESEAAYNENKDKVIWNDMLYVDADSEKGSPGSIIYTLRDENLFVVVEGGDILCKMYTSYPFSEDTILVDPADYGASRDTGGWGHVTFGEDLEPGNYVIMGAEDDVTIEVRHDSAKNNGYGGYLGSTGMDLSDDSIEIAFIDEGFEFGFSGMFYLTPVEE